MEIKHHLDAQPVLVSSSECSEYYLNPEIQIIHICLTVPRYRDNPAYLIQDLGINSEKLALCLQKLEQMRLILRQDNSIVVLKENLHLPRESPLYRTWRNQLKLMSMYKLDNTIERNPYSFMVVFSCNEEVRTEIQNRFLKFINGIEKLVDKSPKEDVFQLNFDLFSWTKTS
jgi:hypothetical protein